MQQARRQVDTDIETLAAAAPRWANFSATERAGVLRELKQTVLAASHDWVQAASRAKGLRPGSPLEGEEWISGPWAVLYALTRYIRTLESVSQDGHLQLPPIRQEHGRTIVQAFPRDAYDRLLLSGIHADVWMQPGVTPDQARAQAARAYRKAVSPSVALVLGAGNISSIAPLDILYKMVAEGAVCIVKLNPVNDYLGPVFERAFRPLLDRHFVKFAYGGADAGSYLCAHPLIDSIHITGSEQTHSAIAAAIAGAKPITSELGNVSPTIVVPGPWTRRELEFQAQNIATQKAHNAGANCIAAQVLIVPQNWEHTDALLDAIAGVFTSMEQRPEYYPGSTARRLSHGGPAQALRGIVHVDADAKEHPAFRQEAFCGVLAQVRLPGNTVPYLSAAVRFANNTLHGTLGANLIVHPRTIRQHSAAIDAAIRDLRYGCVAVNTWTGVGYFITETPWGAYPGHTLQDPRSGIGVVHNAFLLQHTEKSVVYGPFRPFPRSVFAGEWSLLPKPPWFITNRAAAQVGRALCEFEAARTPQNAMRVAALALRG